VTQHSNVFIVGAGPSGLTLANLLALYGISFRIIDRYPSPLVLSKAAAIQARSVEVFDAIGIADKMLAESNLVKILTLRTLHRDTIRLDFSKLEHTSYPYITLIPQYRTEELLIERLDEQGIEIERNKVMTDFTHHESGVTIEIQDAEGRVETATATYLVGADGAKSTVRRLLGFDFVGDNYVDPWVLFDAELEWDIPRNEMTFSSSDDGIYGVFPLPGENSYRVAYTQNHDSDGNPIEPTFEEAQDMMKVVGVDGKIINMLSKFWIFNLQHRQVDDYRHGNVILLGDAAHIHTPFGGQGLNLGVTDAFNLGWKLAMVVKGQAPEKLLDTYKEERHPIGQQVVRSTHIGASSMLLRKPSFKRSIREIVMPVLNMLAPAKKRLIHNMSQLAHNYKNSRIVSGSDGNLSAGERLPNMVFVDGIDNSEKDLYSLLDSRYHTLFLVGDDIGRLSEMAKAVAIDDKLSVVIISKKAGNSDFPLAFDSQEMLPLRNNAVYLIRPDRMIGAIDVADNVLSNVERWLSYR